MTHLDSASCRAKRRQILAGAREVFGELGFERASVDQVAARAGVSKATVYNHFKDKKGLFVASFSEEADSLREGVRSLLRREPTGPVEPALEALGRELQALFLAPEIVAFHRHASAEVARFPEIGELVYEHGPGMLYASVADWLRRWHERGALRIADPRRAAVQFVMLCKGDHVVRAQLGLRPTDVAGESEATVRGAVAMFLASYRA